ncbi:hypothetical protein TRFO_18177 [Tritrichomonas foetus]|uniref:t-SNARE coiled-coil homology domain-containing protein n=1 Tax=Tritrichomonas foetus TaxID=1144522 RepID=A0A1J4KR76_9EUKA|nr:hypothetical protein TRFO_18177 [Tritrichomonas foetus]|eukprot:OHT12174.1 hypothetical protein TRFO_18177 [Tritrichomonas foetus]
MYLPTQGICRDRTTTFKDFRGPRSFLVNDRMNESSYLLPKKGKSISLLSPYFELYHFLKSRIAKLYVASDHLSKLQSTSLRPSFCDYDALIDQINAETNIIQKEIKDISSHIEQLDSSNALLSESTQTILMNIKISLKSSLNEFNSLFKISQQSYSANFVKATKNLNGVNKKYKEIEAETEFTGFSYLKSENNINLQNMSIEQQNTQTEDEIRLLEQRAETIKSLFSDLYNIIEMQNDPISRIDGCIEQSLINVQKAHDEVEKASHYQKKSRMWFCAIILFIAIVCLFIGVCMKK